MPNKKFVDFPTGTYDTSKVFLQADPTTGALQKVNLPALGVAQSYVDTGLGLKLDATKKPIVSTVAGLRTQTNIATDVLYQTTDNGGGQWYFDSTDTTSADNIGTVIVTTGGQRLKRIIQGDYLVKWFGAKGDGTTDETTLLNAIIQAVPANCNLILEAGKIYNVSNKLILDKPINLIGQNASLNKTTADGIAISIRSSNVSINCLKVNGAGNASYVGSAYLITTENSSEALFYDNIKIENCTIYNNTSTGVWLEYITNFTINNNILYDFPYAGIMVLSGIHGVIKGNSVTNIHGTGTVDLNCYGISVSANGGLSDVSKMSTDIAIWGNTIKDVPTWEGLDTHGGQNISFKDNKITNVQTGIAVVRHDYVLKIGSKNIVIESNIINTNSPTGNGAAIRVQGMSDTDLSTAMCTNNQCSGGFIYFTSTENSLIASNSIVKPSRGSGILFGNVNDKINIIGNVIQDPYDSEGGNSSAIQVTSGYTLDGLIQGNVLKNTGFVNPYNPAFGVGSYGLLLFSTGSNIIFGENDFSAALIAEYNNNVQQPVKFSGNGSPEGVKTACIGSTYTRLDGGSGTTFYVKEAGSLSTGWTAMSGALSRQAMQIGFGANSTSGTLDWNDTSNNLPGSTSTLLTGTATNGPGDGNYYHPFNFEFNTKNGSGNITQFAIPYNAGQVQFRLKYSSVWSAWKKLLDTSTAGTNYLTPTGNGSGLTGLTATQVGLGNVNNTSDANKPVSTATQTALNLKANLASPTFTGTVNTAAIVNSGSSTAVQYKLSALNTAPISSTDTGTLGEIRVTSGYIYVCTATNTWVRSALTTW